MQNLKMTHSDKIKTVKQVYFFDIKNFTPEIRKEIVDSNFEFLENKLDSGGGLIDEQINIFLLEHFLDNLEEENKKKEINSFLYELFCLCRDKQIDEVIL